MDEQTTGEHEVPEPGESVLGQAALGQAGAEPARSAPDTSSESAVGSGDAPPPAFAPAAAEVPAGQEPGPTVASPSWYRRPTTWLVAGGLVLGLLLGGIGGVALGAASDADGHDGGQHREAGWHGGQHPPGFGHHGPGMGPGGGFGPGSGPGTDSDSGPGGGGEGPDSGSGR